jgi:hypothetical protein
MATTVSGLDFKQWKVSGMAWTHLPQNAVL